MFEELLTEQINPASEGIDALPTEAILRIINEEDHKVPAAVQAEIPKIAKAVEAAASAIRAGGRMFYVGAGTSGRLGVLDAAEIPPTFNLDTSLVQGILAGGEQALTRSTEAAEDHPEIGAADLESRGCKTGDIVVGIAASGRTPYVLGAIAAARGIGAVTIGISCTPDSELSRAVDIPITPLTGPEIIAGSTRMKAGTATKLILNMLSTATMIRLGHVYGNLMVNVQPNNSKLLDRATRIVSQAIGVDYAAASELLRAAGGVVKTAIVMGKLGIGRQEAEKKLEHCEGRVSEAIQRYG
jgi:N-acetylmuramic acid 6-phosphate etherase